MFCCDKHNDNINLPNLFVHTFVYNKYLLINMHSINIKVNCNNLLLLNCHNDCTNAPQCCVIRTSPVLFF